MYDGTITLELYKPVKTIVNGKDIRQCCKIVSIQKQEGK